MKNKPTLEHFKGTATEAKFSNDMTIEVWYSGALHKYEDAKILMSEVVKCWNMHDELVEMLIEVDKQNDIPPKDWDKDTYKHCQDVKELIKKITDNN